jgi:hypothetical protein
MILSLSTLLEPDANWWLWVSELTLVVFAVILTIGLVGEWPDAESWKKRWLYKAAKAAVVLGVVGELIGDAGIFETSARLTVLQHAAIGQASIDAANANERAGNAIREAANANEKAAGLEKDAAQLRIELAKLKLPRHMAPLDAAHIAAGKEYLTGKKYDLSASPDFEPMAVAEEIRGVLGSIGMVEQLSNTKDHWTPPNGGLPIGTILRPGIAVRETLSNADMAGV